MLLRGLCRPREAGRQGGSEAGRSRTSLPLSWEVQTKVAVVHGGGADGHGKGEQAEGDRKKVLAWSHVNEEGRKKGDRSPRILSKAWHAVQVTVQVTTSGKEYPPQFNLKEAKGFRGERLRRNGGAGDIGAARPKIMLRAHAGAASFPRGGFRHFAAVL